MFIKSILKNVMAASVVAVGGALVYKALENPKILSKAVTVTDIALDKIEELQDKICNRIDDLEKAMADTDDEGMDDDDMDDEDMDDEDMDDEDMDDDNYLDDDMDDDNYLDDDMDDEGIENGGINDGELADTDKLLGDTTEDIFDKISKMSKSYRNDEDTLNRMLYGDANKADK